MIKNTIRGKIEQYALIVETMKVLTERYRGFSCQVISEFENQDRIEIDIDNDADGENYLGYSLEFDFLKGVHLTITKYTSDADGNFYQDELLSDSINPFSIHSIVTNTLV